jgi:hypothetical protein
MQRNNIQYKKKVKQNICKFKTEITIILSIHMTQASDVKHSQQQIKLFHIYKNVGKKMKAL